MKIRSTLIGFLIVIVFKVSFAQPGSLDTTFSNDGTVVTNLGEIANGRSVAIQTDGKIIVSGFSGSESGNYLVVRYNTNGSLDTSFGNDGIVTMDFGNDDRSYSVALQSDGKIIVAGTSNAVTGINAFAIVRYNQNGSIDNSFSTVNSNGFFTGPFGHCKAVALQPDGNILAVGTAHNSSDDFLVVRYKTDGFPDNSFGVNGVTTTDFEGLDDRAHAIAIQPDGKIIAAGTSNNGEHDDFALVRYNIDGSLDNTFGAGGIETTDAEFHDDLFQSIVIQPDGKIVAAGMTVNWGDGTFHKFKFALVRYLLNGTLDNSFGTNGKVLTIVSEDSGGRDVVLQPDGKIIVVGYTQIEPQFIHGIALVRYNEEGILDNSFGTDGIVITNMGTVSSQAFGCVLQPDGDIVVVGDNEDLLAVARYISGSNLGVISFSKQDYGLLIYPNPLQENTMIEYTLTNDETISIDLYDFSGRLVQSIIKSEKRDKGPHKEKIAIDAAIPSGSYFLTIGNGKGSSTVQVVK